MGPGLSGENDPLSSPDLRRYSLRAIHLRGDGQVRAAQPTHSRLSGRISSRPAGIAPPHLTQVPYVPSSTAFNARSICGNRFRSRAFPASEMLWAWMASMRVSRPIALSGRIWAPFSGPPVNSASISAFNASRTGLKLPCLSGVIASGVGLFRVFARVLSIRWLTRYIAVLYPDCISFQCSSGPCASHSLSRSPFW